MPIHYVEDYEELTGLKREDSPVVETKVVGAPVSPKAEPATVAEVE